MSKPREMYIAGAFTGAADGKTFEDKDPSTGKVWASVPDANRADTKRAIDAAAEAFPKWSRMSPSERSKCLLRAADLVEKRKE
jgi:acyl-CoA reductase-like NAD-dependent aldehyde dehydrogenase